MPSPYGLQMQVPGTYGGGQCAFVDPSGTSYPGFDMIFKTRVKHGLSYVWSGGGTDSVKTITTPGLYKVTVTDSIGCTVSDSVIIAQTIIDTTVTQLGMSLTSADTNAHHQWYDCDHHSLMGGDTSRIFFTTVNGHYAVILTRNGCVDTSSCFELQLDGEQGVVNHRKFTIHPNPAATTIEVAGPMCIYDVLGKMVLNGETIEMNTSTALDISSLPPGIYFLKPLNDSNSSILKLVHY